MTVTLVGTPTHADSLTGTESAGTAAGDMLVAHLATGDNAAHTGPAGWTQLDQVTQGGNNVASTWAITRGGSAPALVWSGGVSPGISIVTLRSTALPLVVDGHDMTAVASTTTPSSPTLTASKDGDVLLCTIENRAAGADATTVPSGMSSQWNGAAATVDAGATLTGLAIGATGAKQWTLGAGVGSVTASVLVRDTVSGGGSPRAFTHRRRRPYGGMG